MRTPLTLLLCSVAVACERGEAPVEDGDVVAATGQADADAMAAGDMLPEPGEGTAILAAQTVTLPPGWQGSGVLAKRGEKLPRGAPAWSAILAEVVLRKDQRFLQTTGRAERIKNKALARTTAENRARAEMTRWVASNRLLGTQVVDSWQHPKTGITLARVAMPVPMDWVPGQKLPDEGAPAEERATP